LWDRYPSLGIIITSDKRGALAVKSHQLSRTKSLTFSLLMMMNEEKQSVEVSKQPIVFVGYISFSFLMLLLFYSDVIKTIILFISSLCLFVKTNRGRYMLCLILVFIFYKTVWMSETL